MESGNGQAGELMTDEAIYYRGETVALHCDIFPGFVHPEPPGVPGNGIRKRVVVTERCLTICWSVSGEVHRMDIPMSKEQTSEVTLRGGAVGDYEVGRDNGCSTCGAGSIKNYRVWPGVIMKQESRTEKAAAFIAADSTYGLPSRYTRSR
jgi:hypothetical protein